MKEIINSYKKYKNTVDNYVLTSIKNESGDYIERADAILKKNSFIQLVYEVDKDFRQVSPVICRRSSETSSLRCDKSHYFTKLMLDKEGFYISNPYIHYRTGKASITVVRKVDENYFVFDCDLILLLEELKLIEYNSLHERIKRGVYIIGSTLLAAIALILILYGGWQLVSIFFMPEQGEFFHVMFKSIIAVTLGIAVFDLSKQIMEHEVLFHSFTHEEERPYKILGKFLVSIVIALSIETLMVVFKITLDNYNNMLSAFYLLIGTTAMFVGLAYFYKTITKRSFDTE